LRPEFIEPHQDRLLVKQRAIDVIQHGRNLSARNCAAERIPRKRETRPAALGELRAAFYYLGEICGYLFSTSFIRFAKENLYHHLTFFHRTGRQTPVASVETRKFRYDPE